MTHVLPALILSVLLALGVGLGPARAARYRGGRLAAGFSMIRNHPTATFLRPALMADGSRLSPAAVVCEIL
jgi:hypothetical protein